MFGYVMPEKSELKVKEYEMFRAFYCGVCKSIGKRSGNFPRVTLNYDLTFLALLLNSISDESLKITQKRCFLHPVKKKNIIYDNKFIDYAADMNIILSYYNLKDDVIDNKSIVATTGTIVLYPYFKKIRRKYKEKCDIIENKLDELIKLEKNGCSSIDQLAEPFSKIMEEVMTYSPLCDNKGTEDMLRWMGYNIGKWIYILDAYEDMEKDSKSNKFNPILSKYGDKAYSDEVKERIRFVLIYSLDQIVKTYELMNIKKIRGIVENIIYLGMLKKTEKILGVGSCKSIESI